MDLSEIALAQRLDDMHRAEDFPRLMWPGVRRMFFDCGFDIDDACHEVLP